MTPLPKNKRQQLAFRRALAKGLTAPNARAWVGQGRKYLTPRPNTTP